MAFGGSRHDFGGQWAALGAVTATIYLVRQDHLLKRPDGFSVAQGMALQQRPSRYETCMHTCKAFKMSVYGTLKQYVQVATISPKAILAPQRAALD